MLKHTFIQIPHYNDSFSRIVLDNTVYHIRFSYNNATECWKFGLYSADKTPILQDIKIVPGIPLNYAFCRKPYPRVIFGANTKKKRIGYQDFWDGYAEFFYMELTDGIRES